MLETLLTSKKSSFVGHALIILLWDLVWLNYRKLLILHFEQPAPPGSSSSFFFLLNLILPTSAFLHMKKTTITLLQRWSCTLSLSILKLKNKNCILSTCSYVPHPAALPVGFPVLPPKKSVFVFYTSFYPRYFALWPPS